MAKNSVKHSANSYEKLKKGNLKKRAAVLGLLSVMTITSAVPALAATTTTADTSTGVTVSTEAVSDQTLSVSTMSTADTTVSTDSSRTLTVSTMSTGKYCSTSAAYTKLNNFRTKKGVWYWNKNNKTKTVFNKSGKTTLKKLKKSSSLEKTAKTRAKEIAKKFSHTRPNGKSYSTAFASSYSATGECIAYGYDTAAEVIEAWKEADAKYNGQGHRRNMLSTKFTQVGIACYEVNGVKYWVMDLGSK